MLEQRLRPETKPLEMSEKQWRKSECKASPTGSHYFTPNNHDILRCKYCLIPHTK